MAKEQSWGKDVNIINLATVNGVEGTAASATVDWDIYELPQYWNELAFQACIIACGSASLNSIVFRVMGGLDRTNWISLASITLSDTANSGASTIRFMSNTQCKYLKLSLSYVSYGEGTNCTSLASVRALIFANV
jgi:hypothetical protein